MFILETERLLFRDHEPGDLDAYCAMEADPEVRRYVGGQPRSREAAEEKFHRVYLPQVPDRLALWRRFTSLSSLHRLLRALRPFWPGRWTHRG